MCHPTHKVQVSDILYKKKFFLGTSYVKYYVNIVEFVFKGNSSAVADKLKVLARYPMVKISA